MITSHANEKIKNIRRLRERKERQQSGTFYIEGLRIVGEAFQTQAKIETLVVSPDLLTSSFGQKMKSDILAMGIPEIEVSREIFESLSTKEGPQGIAAVVRQKWQNLNELNLGECDLWIALDSVQDPGNLGTIFRTADSVGAKGIILLDSSTDPYDPATVRASMGAIFSLNIIRAVFPEFTDWKQANRVPVIGSSGIAKSDYVDVKYPKSMILMMGSERLGLQAHHVALCDEVVSIPMIGRSDSLNLAVATAIILYEIFNQHRGK
jgi:RNA methyltransferase, TrmH family